MFRSVTTRLAGFIILIAGMWGALIPFVGPYFHFTLGPDHTWVWNTGRLYLDVLPAIAAVVGGLFLLAGGPWLSGRFGALLALAGGIWFAAGPDVSRLWHGGGAQGFAHGHGAKRMLEFLTLHSGIGVLITALAAYSLPGILAYRHARTGVAPAAGTVAAADAAAATHGRDRVAAREGEPVATTRAGEPVAAERAGEPVAAPNGEAAATREPIAAPNGEAAATGEPAGAPSGGAATEREAGQTQTVTRRRGGLFSRR